MYSYNELLNKISLYLDKDEVEDNELVISGDKFIKILDKYFDDLKNIYMEKERLNDDLNEYFYNINLGEYNDKLPEVKKLFTFFGKSKKDEKKKKKFDIETISSLSEEDGAPTLFIEYESSKLNKRGTISLGYEKDSNDIFIRYSYIDTEDFLDKYLDRVINILCSFSRYINTGVGKFRNDKDTVVFEDDGFKLTVRFDSKGKINYSFDISDDKEGVTNYEWVNKASIRSFIDKDIDLYLKRFKVNVDALEEPFKGIVIDALKKDNKVIKKDN